MAQPIPVSVRRTDVFARSLDDWLHVDLETDLRRAKTLANWLDAKFEVGGIRFGFDSIIGLIPLIGDVLTSLVGLYPLLVARRYKLGKWVQVRMATNLIADSTVGLVPLVGDALDTAFKSHLRNLKLLEKAASRSRVGQQRSPESL